MNTIWYRFYSEKDSYQIPFNTTEISIGDIKKEIEKRRNMYKFPENFDLIFYDEENFEKIEDKDLVKPMKHLIIKRFPQYKRENNFVQIVRDPHDIPMNKINENGFRRGEPQKIIRYTEPLEKIKKKLNREMINKQFKCRFCDKFDDETLFNAVISLCCKETYCLNCYNKNENKCPNSNCGKEKRGYVRNEAVINLAKKLLNILEKKEEEERKQREAAIKQMNMAFDSQGNNIVNNDGIVNNQRNLNNNINNQTLDNSNIKYNLTGINTELLNPGLNTNNLYQLPNENLSNSLLEGSQFFIIKSSNRENIEKSKKNSVWATTLVNSNKLNDAFKKGKVILIFSASGTQSYQGYAIMTSCTADTPSNLWQIENNIKLGGNFSVVWLCFCELSFSRVKHLQNTKKSGEPVNKSRDCTELPPIIGNELCKLCYEQEKKDLINNPQQAKVPINEQLIEKINEEIKNNRNKQLKKYNKLLNINNNEQNENNTNNNKPNENVNNQNTNNSAPPPIPQIQNPNNMMPMPSVPILFYNPYWNAQMQLHPHGQMIPNPMIPTVMNPPQSKQENDKSDKTKKEKERNREKDKNRKSNKKRDRDRRNRSRDRDSRSRSRNKSRSSRYSDSDSSRSDGRSKYSKKSYK